MDDYERDSQRSKIRPPIVVSTMNAQAIASPSTNSSHASESLRPASPFGALSGRRSDKLARPPPNHPLPAPPSGDSNNHIRNGSDLKSERFPASMPSTISGRYGRQSPYDNETSAMTGQPRVVDYALRNSPVDRPSPRRPVANGGEWTPAGTMMSPRDPPRQSPLNTRLGQVHRGSPVAAPLHVPPPPRFPPPPPPTSEISSKQARIGQGTHVPNMFFNKNPRLKTAKSMNGLNDLGGRSSAGELSRSPYPGVSSYGVGSNLNPSSIPNYAPGYPSPIGFKGPPRPTVPPGLRPGGPANRQGSLHRGRGPPDTLPITPPPRTPTSPAAPPPPGSSLGTSTLPSDSSRQNDLDSASEATLRPEQQQQFQDLLSTASSGGTLMPNRPLPNPHALPNPHEFVFNPGPSSDSDSSEEEGGTSIIWDKPPQPFDKKEAFMRPPPEQVYERLDEYFKHHDLDKPVIEAASGGTSPTNVDQPILPLPPAILPGNRFSHKKSIRHVADEHKRRINRDRTSMATDLRQKRSTKLWGSKLEEVTSGTAMAMFAASNLSAPESPTTAPKRMLGSISCLLSLTIIL